MDNAIKVESVDSEYKYISDRYGKKDVDWKLEKQVVFEESGNHYDEIKITLNSGEEKIFYFDVSSFWGK